MGEDCVEVEAFAQCLRGDVVEGALGFDDDVVSYVAPSPISSWSFNAMDFANDVDARTQVTSAWYLTSIQAGFEPWNGGTGLAVTASSADVTTGKCLDAAGQNTGNGTRIQIYNCYGGAGTQANQVWTLR